jgi:hypothetical protein
MRGATCRRLSREGMAARVRKKNRGESAGRGTQRLAGLTYIHKQAAVLFPSPSSGRLEPRKAQAIASSQDQIGTTPTAWSIKGNERKNAIPPAHHGTKIGEAHPSPG